MTAGNLVTVGTLTVTDPDTGQAAFQAGSTAGSYGTLTINAAGAWTYTASNGQAAIQSLGAGASLTETFTVRSADGTAHVVTVTINGANDNPVAANTSITTNEDLAKSGTLPVASDVDGDTITYAAAALPLHGTLVINTNGTYTYTPAANYNGPDSFTYTVSDGNGGSNTYTVSVTVTSVNDAPSGLDKTIGLSEDTTYTFTAADFGFTDVNDSPSNTLQSVIITTLPGNGTLRLGVTVVTAGQTIALASLGTLNWTPAANANGNGLASFTFQTVDNGGVANGGQDRDQSPNTITFNVTPVADPAVIGGTASGAVTEDVGVTAGNLVTSGTLTIVDPDAGEAVFQAGSTAGTYGTLTINAAGVWTYTASNSQIGVQDLGVGETRVETFTVLSADGTAQTITVTINGTNDNPVALDDTNAGGDRTTLSGNVIAGTISSGTGAGGADSDIDGDTVVVTGVASGASSVAAGANLGLTYGTITIAANGAYTFTPNAAANGLANGVSVVETITYTVSDGNGGTDTATLTLTITGGNDAPVTVGTIANQAASDAQTIAPFPVAGNFTDPDAGDVLTYTATGLPPGLTLNPTTGVISGTIDASASVTGPYTVVVTATDTLGAAVQQTFSWVVSNPAPVARNDALATTENSGLSGSVFANNGNGIDSDPDGDAIRVSLVNGSSANIGAGVAGSNGGTFTINGDGTYTFDPGAAFDNLAAGATRTTTATYTITDDEGGTSSASVTVTVTGVNDIPVAQDDTFTVAEDGTVTIAVRANDTDIDNNPLTITAIDGTAITIGTPVAVANGTVTLTAAGTLIFKPAANYNGPASFTYTISDGGGGTDTAIVSGTVTPVNDRPVATIDGPLSTAEDTPLTITPATLLANDTDIEGDVLTITSVQGAVHGTVTLSGGNVVFTPSANYNGPARFTYTISDGHGGTSTATVNLLVTPVNDAPVAVNDTKIAAEDGGLITGSVTPGTVGQDSDVDGDGLSVTQFTIAGVPGTFTSGNTATIPGVGTLLINGNGTYAFTPVAKYNGAVPDATYTISDGNGEVATATLKITVTPVVDEDNIHQPDGPRLDPPPRDTTPLSLHVDGAVLDAIHEIGGLASIANSFGTDGIVVNATNRIETLQGLAEFHDGRSIVAQGALNEARVHQLAQSLLQTGRIVTLGDWNVHGATGFSLRFTETDNCTAAHACVDLVFESLVREQALIVQFSGRVQNDDVQIVEYRVTQANGKPLPSWLDRAGRDLVVGKWPVSIDTVDLNVTAILSDGSTISRQVRIQTNSGEIQPIEMQKSGALPRTFSDELRMHASLPRGDMSRLAAALGW